MRKNFASVVFLAFAAAAVAASLEAQDSRSGVAVGILREDSVLVPFATYTNGSWSKAWPGIGADEIPRPGPRSLPEIPKAWWGPLAPAVQWELVAPARPRRTLMVTGVTTIQNHCAGGFGLATDYVSRVQIEPNSYPLPYAGIAASRSNVLQPVAQLF